MSRDRSLPPQGPRALGGNHRALEAMAVAADPASGHGRAEMGARPRPPAPPPDREA